MNVKSINKNIYHNQLLKKGIEFASNNSSLFAGGTSLVLSCVARPLSIMAAPKGDKENKKLAISKSLSSALLDYSVILLASIPVARGIKKIDKNPMKYLKPSTINNLKEDGKLLTDSKAYQFATQIFKMGLGFVIAAPKQILSCALIPPILNKIFRNKNKSPQLAINETSKNNKYIVFKGKNVSEPVAKVISRAIDKPKFQNVANKYKDSNYAMHIPALKDIFSTGVFVHETNRNKKINIEKKKTLNNYSLISTGLSIASSYVIDKALDKPTNKFIENFSKTNLNNPKLPTYIEGIKIVKPTIIMGLVYYIAVPFASTLLTDKISKKKKE